MIKLFTKKLVFRVRKRYFDDIVNGRKIIEYRNDSPFWEKRVFGFDPPLADNVKAPIHTIFPNGNWIAVFICGKQIHRRQIMEIDRIKTPNSFSEQGKKDVNTPYCFAFHLGRELKT